MEVDVDWLNHRQEGNVETLSMVLGGTRSFAPWAPSTWVLSPMRFRNLRNILFKIMFKNIYRMLLAPYQFS